MSIPMLYFWSVSLSAASAKRSWRDVKTVKTTQSGGLSRPSSASSRDGRVLDSQCQLLPPLKLLWDVVGLLKIDQERQHATTWAFSCRILAQCQNSMPELLSDVDVFKSLSVHRRSCAKQQEYSTVLRAVPMYIASLKQEPMQTV